MAKNHRAECSFGKASLGKSDMEKDLGVLADQSLTWSTQCHAAAGKTNTILAWIKL